MYYEISVFECRLLDRGVSLVVIKAEQGGVRLLRSGFQVGNLNVKLFRLVYNIGLFWRFLYNSLAIRIIRVFFIFALHEGSASLLYLRAARRIQLYLSLGLSESELLATNIPPVRAFHKTIYLPSIVVPPQGYEVFSNEGKTGFYKLNF